MNLNEIHSYKIRKKMFLNENCQVNQNCQGFTSIMETEILMRVCGVGDWHFQLKLFLRVPYIRH